MALTNLQKNNHLLWRAGFGPMAEMLAETEILTQNNLWALLQQTSAQAPEKIIVASKAAATDNEMQPGAQLKARLEKNREEIKTLNQLWLNQIINSPAQLREKVAFFFHGHFACRVLQSQAAQDLLHIIRTNALGSFKDMLFAVSKSAAMLQFLNNQQNKKDSPNENFAREVMELFTLGRGNYTETDIKEAARAFTGWASNRSGEFVFRTFTHDSGSKTILNKTGNFTGDDVLNILLAQKQTAVFITQKMYKFFVNENVNNQHVNQLANNFFASNYNIMQLLQEMFTSTWFYAQANVGNKIKAPIELLAGIRRFLPMQLTSPGVQLLLQRSLGQVLFFPPNVAGWPGGKNWIDSSTLLLRLRLPKIFAAQELLTINAKDDDDVQMGEAQTDKRMANVAKAAVAKIDWALVLQAFNNTPRQNLLQQIANSLLQTPNTTVSTVIAQHTANNSKPDFIKTAVVNFMCTPEYQLC
jgi:uncharacterized protein (DUF1800 family)